MLTAERLRFLLDYHPETGEFTWRNPSERQLRRVKVGDKAGCSETAYGYCVMGVDMKLYRRSRLAWLFMTGEWPKNRVDHINQNRLDDRWCNLRECTHSQNLANTGLWKHNTSGYKGVHFHPQTNKWRARIHCNGKTINLGLHPTPEEAAKVHKVAARRLFGEFAPI